MKINIGASPNFHYIKLYLDGKVVYEVTGNSKELQNVVLLENAVDILSSSFAVEFSFYVLDDNGDVYEYSLVSLDKYDIPKKEKVASEITKLMRVNYFPQSNAGGCWSFVGVTTDGKLMKLSGECV